MHEAHEGLGITGEEFAAVAGHLQATLADRGVPEEHAETVMGEVVAD